MSKDGESLSGFVVAHDLNRPRSNSLQQTRFVFINELHGPVTKVPFDGPQWEKSLHSKNHVTTFDSQNKKVNRETNPLELYDIFHECTNFLR